MDSLKAYEEKYESGYGLAYPDGHVVRFYERILKYKLGFTPGCVLDFGCGNGTHLAYFKEKGWEIRGVDIVAATPKGLFENEADFKKIAPAASLSGLFSEQIDLVFANQSLYYLDFEDFKRTLSELYAMTRPGGLIFATMISEKNYYFPLSTGEKGDFLRKVSLKGRLNEESFMFFVKDAQELKELFTPYKPLFLGEYDPINFFDFEGSAHHYIYVGIKE